MSAIEKNHCGHDHGKDWQRKDDIDLHACIGLAGVYFSGDNATLSLQDFAKGEMMILHATRPLKAVSEECPTEVGISGLSIGLTLY